MKMRLCGHCKKLFEETDKIKITLLGGREGKCSHCKKGYGYHYEVYVCPTNNLSKAN